MPQVSKKFLNLVLIIDLVVVNGLVFGLLWARWKTQLLNSLPGPALSPLSPAADSCGPNCQAYIDRRLADFRASMGTSAAVATPKPTVQATAMAKPAARVKQTFTFPVPGSGSTSANDWTDLPGTEFYFDTSDYPGLTEVRLEVNLKLVNGNGLAYVRLFDVTHGIGIAGSVVQTNSQANTVVLSDPLALWQGNNLYRVQAKSLTADTAVFGSGLLTVTTEN